MANRHWISGIVFAFTTGALAQSPDWKALNDAAIAQYRKADYAQAEVTATQAVEAATAKFGAEHSNVATCLNNLAAIYRSEKKYAAAEPLYARVLAIREKS